MQVQRLLRPNVVILLALLGLVALAAVSVVARPALSSIAANNDKAPVRVRATGRLNPSVPLPPASPRVCGRWSSATSQTGAAIAQRYGEIRNCGWACTGRSIWFLTTLGNASSPGAIGVVYCNTEACRDGTTDHPFAGWRFFQAPYPGGVTLLGQTSPTTLIVDDGGHQITFDLSTDTYSS
jgi:hypothetical protein